MAAYKVRVELEGNAVFQRQGEELNERRGVGGDRSNSRGRELYRLTLFDHDGKVVFAFENRPLDDGVREVCAFINSRTETVLSKNRDPRLTEDAANRNQQQGR
jgi:hypothetical protein